MRLLSLKEASICILFDVCRICEEVDSKLLETDGIFFVSRDDTLSIMSRSWSWCERDSKIRPLERDDFLFWTLWREKSREWFLTTFFLDVIAKKDFYSSLERSQSRSHVLSRANHSCLLYSRQKSTMKLRCLRSRLKWMKKVRRKLAMQILSISFDRWKICRWRSIKLHHISRTTRAARRSSIYIKAKK